MCTCQMRPHGGGCCDGKPSEGINAVCGMALVFPALSQHLCHGAETVWGVRGHPCDAARRPRAFFLVWCRIPVPVNVLWAEAQNDKFLIRHATHPRDR